MTPDAPQLVDRMLEDALRQRASDVHVEPVAAGYEVRYRVDGLLQTVATHDAAAGRSIVSRLMVMAQLLTYRLDVPQEGRLQVALPQENRTLEMRLAVIPTVNGMRAAVRLPADLMQPRKLESLGLPSGVIDRLLDFTRRDSGMLIVTGPAGAGKTTTIYALLEKIADVCPGLSIIALEDPVERRLAGVTQIEVRPFGELTYEKALRSILRQDPQVLMLGEIRDAATAALAIQAALSGHRLICTLHAATPAGAVARLLEMGLEPYQITSALFGVLNQRLLRRRKPRTTGFEPVTPSEPGEGYSGRTPVAQIALMDAALRAAILARGDAESLREAYEKQQGFVTMASVAEGLLASGLTDEAEIRRVLG